jgi:hypothetical protein
VRNPLYRSLRIRKLAEFAVQFRHLKEAFLSSRGTFYDKKLAQPCHILELFGRWAKLWEAYCCFRAHIDRCFPTP